MKRRNLTTEPTFHGYPILTDKRHGLAADTRMLREIKRQFDYAEDTKSKAFFYRYDLRFPSDMKNVPQDNGHFSRFASAYQKNLARKGLRPQYVATREQASSDAHQHYHVLGIVDGQKTQNEYGILKTAERLWENELELEADGRHGLVYFCDRDKKTGERMRNGMMIDRNSHDCSIVKDRCFQRASYLAKENTKNTPQGQREFFASRLPAEYRPVKPPKKRS